MLQPLKEGDVVRVRPLTGQTKWFKAQVDHQVAVRSFKVRTEDGRLYRRNRSHLYRVATPTPPLLTLPTEETVQVPAEFPA